LKVLLFGKGGQVGWELQRSLAPLGELIAVDFDPKGNPDGLCGDFSDLPGLAKTIQIVKPDVIVNAAAHTAVDKAETEPDFARTVNALAPGVLAAEANKLGAWLVHYSTDYVFDGSGDKPWREDDIPGPLSVYGQTKLEGEKAVVQCPKHLILRTSWVYAAKGGNFAKTMLRLAKERDKLTVIDDQVGAPTSAELLADVTALSLRTLQQRPELAGVYHCAARGETSWFGYCRHVLARAQTLGVALKAGPDNVTPILTSSYPTPAKRPLNSRLCIDKIEAAFALRMPNWQVHMDRMLEEICGGIAQ
jgi:dTDP-4-dehydrorhamnose reductase